MIVAYDVWTDRLRTRFDVLSGSSPNGTRRMRLQQQRDLKERIRQRLIAKRVQSPLLEARN
jgi:hypothetical protein